MLSRNVFQVIIDGPFGTPTRDIFQTEHAVLIASGIGITPFASILQSVMFRYHTAKHTCQNCDHTWYGDVPPSLMKLKKVSTNAKYRIKSSVGLLYLYLLYLYYIGWPSR